MPRPAWWSDSELLRLSNLVVELISEEAEIDVWQTRALILMGHYSCHEHPRAPCMRTPDQMWEAAKCMRKQARLMPAYMSRCIGHAADSAAGLCGQNVVRFSCLYNVH